MEILNKQLKSGVQGKKNWITDICLNVISIKIVFKKHITLMITKGVSKDGVETLTKELAQYIFLKNFIFIIL